MKAFVAVAVLGVSVLFLAGCEPEASKEASHQSQPPMAATPVNSAWTRRLRRMISTAR